MDYFKILLLDHLRKNKTGNTIPDFDGFVINGTVKQKVIGGRPKNITIVDEFTDIKDFDMVVIE